MKHFLVALVTILLHKATTETFSISYDLLSTPFEPSRFLVDLTLFAAIYLVALFALRGWGSSGAVDGDNDPGPR